MSFDIAIKVDPAPAIAGITKVERELGKAEQAGTKVGAAVSKGMRESGLAAERAKAQMNGLRSSADDLARAYQNVSLQMAKTTSLASRLPDKKTIGGAAKIGGFLTGGAGGLLGGVEAGLAMGGGLGLAIAAAPALEKLGEVAASAADKGLTKLANVLNADFIAIRKANEAFIARMGILRTLIDEEKKTADAVKASQIAGSGLVAVNEDVAMAATKSRVAIQAAFGVDLTSTMSEAEKKAREFAGALEQLKTGDAAAKLARDVERAHQSLNGMGNTLRGQIDDWKDLTNRVDVLRRTVAELNSRRGAAGINAILQGVNPTNLGTKTSGDVVLERQLRDETVKLDNVHSVYGKTVADITLKENAHRDAMSDLKAAYKDGAITAKQYHDQLAALGVQFDKLPEGFRAGKIRGVGVNLGMEKGGGAVTGWGNTPSLVDAGVTGPAAMNVPEITKEVVSLNTELAKTPTLLDQLKTESIAAGMELLTSSFKGLEDQLVSLVTTGKFSFGDLVDSILADMARLASQKLFGALLNYIGGLGGGAGGGNAITAAAGGNFGGIANALFGGSHAFGGDYRVGGSGGPDSQRVMFNLSPGEHVRFTPPGRDPSSGSNSSQPEAKQPITLVMPAGQSEMELERVILKVIHRNNAALRSTLTGR